MTRKTKAFVFMCLVVGLTMLLAYPALAFAKRTYYNFAGVTDAVAEKDVTGNYSNYWTAWIESYTTNPVRNIGTIGWTWWGFRETCNGIIVDNWTLPGYARYGASYAWSCGTDDIDTCGGSHLGWVLGRHDFKEGSSTWQPQFSTSETLH